MQGAATQAMSMHIVEERQRRRCPPAAAPLRAAARRPAGFVARSLHTTTGRLVARASPAGLGPAAKCNLYLLTGPKPSAVEGGDRCKTAVGGPDSAACHGTDLGVEIEAVAVALGREDDARDGGWIRCNLLGHLPEGLPGGDAEEAEVLWGGI